MLKARVSPTPSLREEKLVDKQLISNVAGFMHNNVLEPVKQMSRVVYQRKSSLLSSQPGHSIPLSSKKIEEAANEPPIDKDDSTWIKRYFGDLRTGARTLFALFCIVYSIVQVIQATIYYLKYDTGVSVTVEEPVDLKKALPGMTLCNKNLITKRHAFESIPAFKEEMDKLASEQFSDAKERKRKMVDVSEQYMRSYYAKFPVMVQLDHGPDMEDFVKYLKCNSKGWPVYKDKNGTVYRCELRDRIRTAQGKGNCITLFHEGSKATRSEPIAREEVAVIRKELGEFVPNELLKLVLDFAPENYTDLRMAPGAEIMFHDQRTVPREASLSYTLKPGKYYQIYLKKSSTHSLAPPYVTNCTDYYTKNIQNYAGARNVKEALIHPLSRLQCIENCIINQVVKSSACWPKEIPYWASNHFNLEDNVLMWCNRMNKSAAEKKAAFDNYVRFRKDCDVQCARDCVQDYYELSHQEVDWPPEERILVEEDAVVKAGLLRLKRCCALVSVRYATTKITINDIYPKLKFIGYLADVGGIVSMWIGICMISISDLVNWLVGIIYFKCH